MKLTELSLINYRNYETLQLEFQRSLTIFLGENAQGKTNILESIYFLAMTRSHRTSHEQEIIRWGQEQTLVKGTVQKNSTTIPLEIQLSKKGRKTKVNYLEQKKLSDYIGQMNVILFAPEDLSLVKGSPALRRKFLDMELGQISPLYLYDLVQYQGILKQRNQYLKQLADKKEQDLLYLDILSEQLADFGSKVLFQRLKFIEELEFWANRMHQKISNQKELLKIDYQSSLAITNKLSTADINEIFLQALTKNRPRELFKTATSVGPHRDDLIFKVNDQDVQAFGSQGQQRTTALSIKLAEIDLMKSQTGEYPILLLDDVMSELDDQRQMQLLETIEGKVQTFLTTTTLEHIKGKMAVTPEVFYVTKGSIEREESE